MVGLAWPEGGRCFEEDIMGDRRGESSLRESLYVLADVLHRCSPGTYGSSNLSIRGAQADHNDSSAIIWHIETSYVLSPGPGSSL